VVLLFGFYSWSILMSPVPNVSTRNEGNERR
jgi:hypothetical protein